MAHSNHYKFTILTLKSLLSIKVPLDASVEDETVSAFARLLCDRTLNEFGHASYWPQQRGEAFLPSEFDAYEEKFLKQSEYAVILVSGESTKHLLDIYPRLLVFLTRRPTWINRFLLVYLGKPVVQSQLENGLLGHAPIVFSGSPEDNWHSDTNSWEILLGCLQRPVPIELIYATECSSLLESVEIPGEKFKQDPKLEQSDDHLNSEHKETVELRKLNMARPEIQEVPISHPFGSEKFNERISHDCNQSSSTIAGSYVFLEENSQSNCHVNNFLSSDVPLELDECSVHTPVIQKDHNLYNADQTNTTRVNKAGSTRAKVDEVTNDQSDHLLEKLMPPKSNDNLLNTSALTSVDSCSECIQTCTQHELTELFNEPFSLVNGIEDSTYKSMKKTVQSEVPPNSPHGLQVTYVLPHPVATPTDAFGAQPLDFCCGLSTRLRAICYTFAQTVHLLPICPAVSNSLRHPLGVSALFIGTCLIASWIRNLPYLIPQLIETEQLSILSPFFWLDRPILYQLSGHLIHRAPTLSFHSSGITSWTDRMMLISFSQFPWSLVYFLKHR